MDRLQVRRIFLNPSVFSVLAVFICFFLMLKKLSQVSLSKEVERLKHQIEPILIEKKSEKIHSYFRPFSNDQSVVCIKLLEKQGDFAVYDFRRNSSSCESGVLLVSTSYSFRVMSLGKSYNLTIVSHISFEVFFIFICLFFISIGFTFLHSFFALRKFSNQNSNEIYFGKQVARISHDLRSPLMALQLVSSKIDDKNKAFVLESINRIKLISNEVLNLQRSRVSSVSLEALVSMIESRIREQDLSCSNITFLRNDLSLTDFAVSGAGPRIVEIFSNLINNALENFDETEIIIDLKLKRFFGLYKKLMFTITSTGPLIPKNIITRLGREKLSINPEKKNSTGVGMFAAAAYLKTIGGSIRFKNLSKKKQVAVYVELRSSKN